eukprot:jgi/Botrbrau1/16413/Bobra.0142s0013.1
MGGEAGCGHACRSLCVRLLMCAQCGPVDQGRQMPCMVYLILFPSNTGFSSSFNM